MGVICRSISELIGNTPLLELASMEERLGLSSRLLAKLEYFNPAGSIKDRAALFMINEAERRGVLSKGSVIIEPTSGNTGIALASVAASRGYRVIIVMPDSMSRERIALMKAYGADVVLTPGALGMKGAIDKANELLSDYSNGFIPSQFDNPANCASHYNTTGPELLSATNGDIDYIISTIGTGGTITGLGRFFKEKCPKTRIIGVEPSSSPLLTKGYAAPHKIQGIGANFIPSILESSLIDEILTVEDDEAFEHARLLGRVEGISVGISSGAALKAALEIARRPEASSKTIVAIFPDGGARYLSTPLFDY